MCGSKQQIFILMALETRSPQSRSEGRIQSYHFHILEAASCHLPLSSWPSPFLPACVSSVSLRRTFVFGCGACPDNPEWSQLEILTLITCAETLFPNKAAFVASRGQDMDTSVLVGHRSIHHTVPGTIWLLGGTICFDIKRKERSFFPFCPLKIEQGSKLVLWWPVTEAGWHHLS